MEIFRDIERSFSADVASASPPASAVDAGVRARRLPWSVLPPGQLSLGKVLAHYERLGRARPDVRYEPERIRKAYSLGPDGCYVGSDEFDGYVVFTFPSTRKALLERPVYGNAIYVLGPDWKRLSRLSKRELLADETHGVTRIVHDRAQGRLVRKDETGAGPPMTYPRETTAEESDRTTPEALGVRARVRSVSYHLVTRSRTFIDCRPKYRPRINERKA